MSLPFIGEVRLFGGNFAPRGYAFCNGQILSIAQNTALFSILGTTYGGNGQTTFALPDLRGRVPVGFGQGPGLSSRTLGETIGTETVTLTANEIPLHGHAMQALSGAANAGQGPSTSLGTATAALYGSGPTQVLAGAGLSASGGGQAHNNMAPSLAVHFIIALEGVFPSRN
jgi:microcystin-dependent protein